MQTDYLIVGAGAQGLIFADEILPHTEANITLVDRRDRVGGHWNDAYSFVRLHQPSAFYGVGSRPLGGDRVETDGLNAGLFEQATGLEVLSHFEDAFMRRLLPSGRVRFLPLHDYVGDGADDNVVKSLATGEAFRIDVAKAVVDTAWYGVQTPETHTPGFKVMDDTPFTTPRRLPGDIPGHDHFTVLGGGKTSMDVVIWLIQAGVLPESICWVRPRDSWLTNRETAQPGDKGYMRLVRSQANRIEASAIASSVEDLYLQLERRDELLRIDQSVFPTMFHGATISKGELAVLQRVQDIVRNRRVTSLRRSRMEFGDEARALPENTLFIDCTARAFNYREPEPVFQGKRITPKVIRDGLVSLSVAAIAYIEASYDDEDEKNALTAPPPYEEDLITLPKRYLTEMTTQARWAKEKALRDWARAHRLTGYGGPADAVAEQELKSLGKRVADMRPQAFENLARLIDGASQKRNGVVSETMMAAEGSG